MHRTALLLRLEEGIAVVASAAAGITDDELDRPAPDGGWTARMVAHHLGDSEAIAYARLLRLVAEDHPAVTGYDEATYARNLHYERPVAASLALFATSRAASLELLESLTKEEWGRAGTHPEHGTYGVMDWLTIYADHAHNHAAQLAAARRG